MTFATGSTKKSPLFAALANEVDHRSLMVLLAILVVMLHGLSIIWLLQPTKQVNKTKPLKIMEVVMLPKPEPKPKPEIKPKPEEPKPKVVKPEPPKKIPPKKIPPKKIAGKPPVKEKAPVVHKQSVMPKPVVAHKQIERPKPQPAVHKQTESSKPQPVLTRKPTALPAPTTFASTAKKWTPPAYAPTSSASASKSAISKPAQKTGDNGHDNQGVNSGVAELVQAKPSYPMRAKSRHIEGWVKIAFTVTASGTVTNAHVVGASPPDIFDSSALDAIQKFKFKSKIVNGKAVNGEATKTFRFNLN